MTSRFPRLFAALCTGVCLVTTHLPAQPATAPDAPPTTAALSPIEADLRALVTTIQSEIKAGKKTAAELAEPIKGFDTLLAKHKGGPAEELAQVLVMKAMLYLQVFDDDATATTLLKQVKTDFPKTELAAKTDEILSQIAQQSAAREMQRSLAPGKPFPDFQEKDLEGKPLSIAAYKGKVVLVDFWATWCGPCVAELPNVIAAYKKHHAAGFEIVGISLDKDEARLKSFLKEHAMTWPQYFDGKGWETKVSRQYGIASIPATFLLDQDGQIVATDLRGDDLDKELTRLLAKGKP